jgi:hypothetical protein
MDILLGILCVLVILAVVAAREPIAGEFSEDENPYALYRAPLTGGEEEQAGE